MKTVVTDKASDDNKLIVEISNLKQRYGQVDVVDIPNWTISENQHTLIQGNSGSGKTTLLSIITGLLKPTAGEVHILGQSLLDIPQSKLDLYRAKNFGIVFQDNHLISSLTLAQNIEITAKITGIDIDYSWQSYLLGELGLSDKLDQKPSSFSRGEAQRAALICAALPRPKILVADEPTSALDDHNTEKVMDILNELASKAGSTLLVASHDGRIKQAFDHVINLGENKGTQA